MIFKQHSPVFAPKFKIQGANSTTLFQVNQSDSTNVLTVDTTNGRVGIGIDTPTAKLHVEGETATDTLLQVISTDDSTVNNMAIFDGIDKLRIGANGHLSIGGTASDNYRIYTLGTSAAIANMWFASLLTGGGSKTGVGGIVTVEEATVVLRGGYFRTNTSDVAFTLNNAYGIFLDTGTRGAASTVTNDHGLYVADITKGTSNYAIRTNAGLVVFNEGRDSDSDVRIEGANESNLFRSDASTNRIGIGDGSPDARLDIVGRADEIQIIVQANVTQTANIVEVRSSASAVLASIDGTGVLTTAGYKSSDGSAGITATKTFYASATSGGTVTVLNTVTIKNGIITGWTQA